MTVTCQSCSGRFDVDDSKLPASGHLLKCPHCATPILVRPPALSKRPFAEGPATVKSTNAAGAITADDPELPAPKGFFDADLPAPKRPSTVMPVLPNLPQPAEKQRAQSHPTPPTLFRTSMPMPAAPSSGPRVAPPPSAAVTQARVLTPPPPLSNARSSDPSKNSAPPLESNIAVDFGAAPPGFDDLDESDLHHVGKHHGSAIDIVAPRNFRQGNTGPIPLIADDAPDLVAPKRPSTRFSPSPPTRSENSAVVDEPPAARTPVRPPNAAGPLKLDLDYSDKRPAAALAPRADAPAVLDYDEPIGLAEAAPGLVRSGREKAPLAPKPEVATEQPVDDGSAPFVLAPDAVPVAEPKLPSKYRPLALAAAGGVLVLVAVLGVALLFVDLPHGGKSREEIERSIANARKLLADDTITSYRKAAASQRELADADPKAQVPRGLQAQAQLSVALAGFSSETRLADRRIAEFSPTPKPSEAPELAKARALRSLVDGKTGDAETALRALVHSPVDAAVASYLGWTMLAAGDPVKALEAFKQALTVEPTRAQALYGLARAEESLLRVTGAEKWNTAATEHYKKALKQSPHHLGAALGLERLQKGDAASSEKRVHDLLDKEGPGAGPRELAEAWALLGQRALESGRLADSEQRFRKAVAISPSLTSAKLGLSRVLCALHKGKDAIPADTAVVKAEPKNGEALLVLAEAQLDAGQIAGASRSLGLAEKLAPKSAVAALKGRLDESRSDVGAAMRAISLYREAVAADPHAVEAAMALSRLLARTDHTDEAKTVLEQVEKQAQADPSMEDRLGEAYLATSDLAKAEAAFRDVTARAPEIISARFHLGETLEREGRLDDATALYLQIAALEKNAPGLAERRAALAILRGHLDEALVIYRDALGADTHPTASLRSAAGNAFLRAGKVEEARHLFEQAVRDDDRSEAGQLGLARIALLDGHPDEAEIAARRAVNLGGGAESHLVLGQAAEALGRLSDARMEYVAAEKGAGSSVAHAQTLMSARLGEAHVLVRSGAVKDALSLALSLTKDAGTPTASVQAASFVLLGDCYEELNQAVKAHKAYETALRKDGANAEAAFKLARADADAGRDQAAASLLDRALTQGAGTASYAADAWLLSGDLHRRLHQKSAALAAYKKFLTIARDVAPERKVAQEAIDALQGEND